MSNETEQSTKWNFVLRRAAEDLMRYDLNHDGKVGLQDVVYALSIGDLETAIRALQILTGM